MQRTKLRKYWLNLPPPERKKYIRAVINMCGISRSSAYNFLDNEPPKLIKQTIETITNIPNNQLYNYE